MTGKVFVDTNILVYQRDKADPVKQAKAHQVVTNLWVERSGRLSVQVCNEYFVTVTRKLKPGLDEASAWEDVEALMAWEPSPLDLKTIIKARETQVRYGLSWWDSLIVASAFVLGCQAICSEDLNAGQEYFGMRVINPFVGE